jgi:hypothetical protein
MCDVIVKSVDKSLPTRNTAYAKLACWVGSVTRDACLELFTTNYDLLMEQALEDNRVPFFDGFIGSRDPFFDAHAMEDDVLPGRWARVWKLHGSINWRQDTVTSAVSRREPKDSSERRLIHPSNLKYDESRRMPYVAMIDRLRTFMRQPSPVLLTVGYSFSDAHINAVILEALQRNPSATAFALAFGALDGHEAVPLAEQRLNLSLLAKDGAVIGGRRGTWRTRSDSGLTSPALDWRPEIGTDPASPLLPEFRLGDFGRLADFLSELVGPDAS